MLSERRVALETFSDHAPELVRILLLSVLVSTPADVKRAHGFKIGLQTITIGVLSSLLAAGVGSVVTLFVQSRQTTSITIDSPNGSDAVSSRPVISGRIDNLKAGFVVWSYNEPAGTNQAYPDAGPCRIEKSEYHCFLTGLSLDPTHRATGTQDFTLWVAVVDTTQAATNTERKARLNNQTPFEVVDKNGPVHSGDLIASVQVVCDKSKGCTDVTNGK